MIIYKEPFNCTRYRGNEGPEHNTLKNALAFEIWKRAHKDWPGQCIVETEVKYGDRVLDVVCRITGFAYEIEMNWTPAEAVKKGTVVKGLATETGLVLRDIIVIDASKIPTSQPKMGIALGKFVLV